MKQQWVMEFYAWMQIVMARAAGKLVPWEGLRLVREPGVPGQGQTLDLPTWAYNA